MIRSEATCGLDNTETRLYVEKTRCGGKIHKQPKRKMTRVTTRDGNTSGGTIVDVFGTQSFPNGLAKKNEQEKEKMPNCRGQRKISSLSHF